MKLRYRVSLQVLSLLMSMLSHLIHAFLYSLQLLISCLLVSLFCLAGSLLIHRCPFCSFLELVQNSIQFYFFFLPSSLFICEFTVKPTFIFTYFDLVFNFLNFASTCREYFTSLLDLSMKNGETSLNF